LTPELKQATFTTVAAAVGYNKKRGDQIVLQKVPFHLATASPEVMAGVVKRKPWLPMKLEAARVAWWAAVAASILLLMWMVRAISRRRVPVVEEVEMPGRGPAVAREREGAIEQMRAMVERNPEKIAELLRSWLTEEGA